MLSCEFCKIYKNTFFDRTHLVAVSVFPCCYVAKQFFFKLGFTPCKAEQPLQGIELQEKKFKKDCRVQKIYLEEPAVKRYLLILDLKPLRSQVKGKHSIGR